MSLFALDRCLTIQSFQISKQHFWENIKEDEPAKCPCANLNTFFFFENDWNYPSSCSALVPFDIGIGSFSPIHLRAALGFGLLSMIKVSANLTKFNQLGSSHRRLSRKAPQVNMIDNFPIKKFFISYIFKRQPGLNMLQVKVAQFDKSSHDLHSSRWKSFSDRPE